MAAVIFTALTSACQATTTPAQVGLFHPAQLFPKETDVDGLRLNLVYGLNRNVRGLDVGTLVNRTEQRMVGFSLGTANVVGGDFAGIQGGVFNGVEGGVSGLQFSSLNLSSELRGAQIGFMSLAKGAGDAKGAVSGLQGSLFFNLASELRGAQVGIANLVKGNAHGAQFAVMNVAEGDVRWIQAAVVANFAEGDVDWIQAALWVNVAKSVSGVQWGTWNLAKSISGFQWGTVNVVSRDDDDAAGVKGVQLGLINVSGALRGVQIGALNCSDGWPPIRCFPLFKVRF